MLFPHSEKGWQNAEKFFLALKAGYSVLDFTNSPLGDGEKLIHFCCSIICNRYNRGPLLPSACRALYHTNG